jgi:hypothetical protein
VEPAFCTEHPSFTASLTRKHFSALKAQQRKARIQRSRERRMKWLKLLALNWNIWSDIRAGNSNRGSELTTRRASMMILAAQPPHLPKFQNSIKCWRKPTNYTSKEREKRRECKLGDDDAPLQRNAKEWSMCFATTIAFARKSGVLSTPPSPTPPGPLASLHPLRPICISKGLSMGLVLDYRTVRILRRIKKFVWAEISCLNIQVLVRKMEASIALIRRSLE